jgi:putative transposase
MIILFLSCHLVTTQVAPDYGLCVMNYMVTSNHIHLLVVDSDADVISSSLQLVQGRTAQQYNLRKGRKGAFWSDRYYVTAIESGEHLIRCIVYIDLNMVRAGVVLHPSKWLQAGYQKIQYPPERYRIIDQAHLACLCGVGNVEELKAFRA